MVLNEMQWKAVEHKSQRLLILAGPGTGKTETLSQRILKHLQDGVPPRDCLLISFTNHAAQNMARRIASKNPALTLPYGTFHSRAHHWLQSQAIPAGLCAPYKIIPEHQMPWLLKETVRRWESQWPEDARLLRLNKMDPAALCQYYMRKLRLNLWTSEAFLNKPGWWLNAAQQLQEVYQQLLEELQIRDFDDLLQHMYRLLREYPDWREHISQQHARFYVDEYQDVNDVQVEILKMLCHTQEHWITVVGDDAQSIYGFQGSAVGRIRQFAMDFPPGDVTTLTLNYRSTPQILQVVNEINQLCSQTYVKNLTNPFAQDYCPVEVMTFSNDAEEAAWITQCIQQLLQNGCNLEDIAVLYRKRSITGALIAQLKNQNIPVIQYNQLNVSEKPHIQLFFNVLYLVNNPRDWLAWESLLPCIPMIGDVLSQTIIEDLKQNDWTWDQPPSFSIGRGKRLEQVMLFWENLRNIQAIPFTNLESYFNEVLIQFEQFYYRYQQPQTFHQLSQIQDLFREIQDPVQELKEYLAGVSKEYSSISEWLNQTSLNPRMQTKKEGVILSTIHAAKGLEWDNVFLMGNTENVFPSPAFGLQKNELEEEHRLFYVACSRARKRLYLTSARQYSAGSWRVRGRPSMFLKLQNVLKHARKTEGKDLHLKTSFQLGRDIFSLNPCNPPTDHETHLPDTHAQLPVAATM